MQDNEVYSVQLSKTKGKTHRICDIDIIIPKKPAARQLLNAHKIKKNQKWARFDLPEGFDWNAPEEDYTEEEFKFIDEDFKRRINGVWLMINGVPTWITGVHYYYLQWCKIDIGYPDYRDRDRRFFYFWEACVRDPRSFGMLMVKHRREGATYKGASIILEVVSRSFNATGGIMSKTGADSKEFFLKLVKMFRALPRFYQPMISGTDNPKSVLEFDKPGERITKTSKRVKRSEALGSKIEWKNTAENSFDSFKLKIIVPDEGAKWDEVDVRQNWRVIRPTLTEGRRISGKAFYPSTVNEMTKKGGENFKEMWDDSDPNDRNLNDQTKSGLYRYLTPAYDGLEGFIDEYGRSVIDTPKKPIMGIDGQMITIGAKEYLDNERAGLKNNPTALAEFKRQFPYNADEAFMVDTKLCAFNVEFLYSQYDWNSVYAPKLLTPGDFIWTDGFGSDVKFIPTKSGRWNIVWVPDKEEQNKKIYRDGKFFPGNMDTIVSGVDPYDHDTTTDGNRSNGASYVFRMYNPVFERNSNMFVSEYINRPPTSFILYEDMLKQSIFYGTQILAENNKVGLVNWFIAKGFGHYLMKRPEITNTKYSSQQKTPGIPTTGDSVRESLISVLEWYVYHNVGYFEETNTVGLLYFNRLIKDLLQFEVDKWTKFDATVAAGLTLLASKKNIRKPLNQDNKTPMIREYRIKNNKSYLRR
jgi:hypothetical protein